MSNSTLAMEFKEIVEWMLWTQMASEAKTIDCANEMNFSKMDIGLTPAFVHGVNCNFGNFPFLTIGWCDNLGV